MPSLETRDAPLALQKLDRHRPHQVRGWLDHAYMPEYHPDLDLRKKLRRTPTFTHCCCLMFTYMEVFIESHPEIGCTAVLQEASCLVERHHLGLRHPDLDGVRVEDTGQPLEEGIGEVELGTQRLKNHHPCRGT